VRGLVVGLALAVGLAILAGLKADLRLGLAVMAGLGVGLLAGLEDSATWPASLAFVQLAGRRRTPFQLMRFLNDAHERGVLRAIGPVYQFRHARLQDRLAGVAEAIEEVLADDLRVLGPDHPGTLTARNLLARSRVGAGDLAGAAQVFEEVLADDLRVLGPDHPSTLAARNELAYWRWQAGNVAGATEALRDLLADDLRVLGPDHPDTLATRANLASLLGRPRTRNGQHERRGP
jgi:hypothetical protein